MQIQPFSRKRDLPIIHSWFKLKKIPFDLWDSYIPEKGFSAFEGTEVIAFGFYRKCEGKIAMLDSFCTNPNSSSANRNKAIDILIKCILEILRNKNFKFVITITREETLMNRITTDFDFKEFDAKIFIKPL